MTKPLKLFPSYELSASFFIDIFGPLTNSIKGRRFLLAINEKFSKLTQAIPLRFIYAIYVAETCTEHWVFKYGIPGEVISDNCSKFASKFFLRIFQAW